MARLLRTLSQWSGEAAARSNGSGEDARLGPMAVATLWGWQWGMTQASRCRNIQRNEPYEVDNNGRQRCSAFHICRDNYVFCFPQAAFCPDDQANRPFVKTEEIYALGICVDAGYFDTCVTCGDSNDPAKRVCAFVCAVERAYRDKDALGECQGSCPTPVVHFGRPGECAQTQN